MHVENTCLDPTHSVTHCMSEARSMRQSNQGGDYENPEESQQVRSGALHSL